MKFTRQHRRNARLLWQTVSVGGVPDAERIREVIRTIRKNEGRDAEAVLRCFAQRLAVYIRANRVGVVSAVPLSAQQQAQLSQDFFGTEAARVGVNYAVDPAVIGGVRVERGYQVTDITIARQLEVLKDRLLGN
jgi:F0F1-type ATP synthase delta subunit